MTMACELGGSEVHVWSCSLDSAPEDVGAQAAILSPDELERAGRFRFERDRRRFIAGRSVLRRLLGRYLRERPERLTFSYGPHGKPSLNRAHDARPLFFNASHSDDLAVYAIAPVDLLGVDVERIRAMTDLESIAARFFSPREQAALAGLQGDARTEAFFHCWTRKEAILKAVGAGLSVPLDALDVPVAHDALPCVVELPRSVADVLDWSLHNVHPPAGYVGAVAMPGEGWRIIRARYLPESPPDRSAPASRG
jgi:4'-phosphopantetheinyl transferase